MNLFRPCALALLVLYSSVASTDDPTPTVFGVPLGAPLQFSECVKKQLEG
jgi:hypothetical protein